MAAANPAPAPVNTFNALRLFIASISCPRLTNRLQIRTIKIDLRIEFFYHRVHMENRRQFLRGMAGAAACALQAQTRPLVIDAHCHAGLGQEMTAPWTTNGDLGITLRHMEQYEIEFVANNPGTWLFHCHNLVHMMRGLMTQVRYS